MITRGSALSLAVVIALLLSHGTSAAADLLKLAIGQRLDEASRFVPLERLAVSPQCGFASTELGNPIDAGIQEAKLRLVVELAQDTWGSA